MNHYRRLFRPFFVPCLFATGFVILGTGCGNEDNSSPKARALSASSSGTSESISSLESGSVNHPVDSAVPGKTAEEGSPMAPASTALDEEQGNVPAHPSQGTEVLTAEDHFLCVRATDKREFQRNNASLEGASPLEEICKANAKNVCIAKGYETLITFEVQPVDAGITAIQYFIINHEPDFYKTLSFQVTAEGDFIPATDTEPFFTTDVFASVKCADPFTLPLENRNEIFAENEAAPSVERAPEATVEKKPGWIDSLKESIKGWFKH
jgi:hypothetical protein